MRIDQSGDQLLDPKRPSDITPTVRAAMEGDNVNGATVSARVHEDAREGPVEASASESSAESEITKSRPGPGAGRRGTMGLAHLLMRGGSTLLIIVFWQGVVSWGWVSNRTLPPPTEVWSTASNLLATGVLQQNLADSLVRACLGLLLGVSVGVAMALLAGLTRLGEYIFDAPMQMARTLPVLALVPLFIIWFGIGETSKTLLIALAVTFPIYLNTYAGIRSADPALLEMTATLGIGRWGRVRAVIFPGALVHFLVGLRFSVGISWLMLVVVEQVNANSGIGYLLTQARSAYQTDVIMVGIVTYALLGLSSDIFVRLIEHKALAWRRPSMSGKVS